MGLSLANILSAAQDPKGLVEFVHLDSQITPTVHVDEPLREKPPSGKPDPAAMLLKLVKPRLAVKVVGQDPIVVAPYGVPTANYLPLVALVGAGILGLALYGAVRLVRG